MDFEHFGLSRDILYLGFLLWGAAAAVLLVIVKGKLTLRQKSVRITALFCLAACAIAAQTAAVVLSGGRVFAVLSVYPYAVLFLALGGAVVLFPRAGCSALVFAAFLFAVLMSFSFLTYPDLDEPFGLAVRSTGDELLFRSEDKSWNTQNSGGDITFEAVSVTSYPGCPLIGGQSRGIISGVLRGDTELFAPGGNSSRQAGKARQGGPAIPLFFSRNNVTRRLGSGILAPGFSVSVLFDGKNLYFDPPLGE
jgi:hypothetical protein